MRRHLPALDGLRGVAILMVLLTHCAGGWGAACSLAQDTQAWPATFALPRWLYALAAGSVHGVTLFFVVSAFTLTLRMGGRAEGWGGYAVRRLARVGPGYWLAGLLYTLAAGLAPRLWAPNGVAASDLVVAALFGSAWQGGAALAVVPGGWSVCCEVAFYAALSPLLWLVAGRAWCAALLALLALLAALAVQLAARHAMALGAWGYVPGYVHPLSQAPVFLLGITAALVAGRLRLPRLPGAALALLALAVLVLPLLPQRPWWLLPHLLFAGLAAAAVALAALHPPRLLCGALARVGEVSYSMYLLHFALLAPSLTASEWLVPARDWRTLVLHTALTALASLGLACLTHRWVEQPAMFWAARWGKGRLAAQAVPGG